MLVMHRHPDNKGVAPTLVNSTQRVYPRTGVDANSRWRVHWDNVGQADMSAGLDSMALKHVVVAVQCEEGSLTIECESGALSLPRAQTLPSGQHRKLTIRAAVATYCLLDPPPPRRTRRKDQGVQTIPSPLSPRWWNALRGGRSRSMYS